MHFVFLFLEKRKNVFFKSVPFLNQNEETLTHKKRKKERKENNSVITEKYALGIKNIPNTYKLKYVVCICVFIFT